MSKIRKALVAAATGALAAGSTALPDGITDVEWMSMLVAAIIAGYAVWQVPNATPSTIDTKRSA